MSFWQNFKSRPLPQPLKGEIHCDVAVIGAGLAGQLTAYLLSKAGLKCAVVERAEPCSGVTRGTSAKITAQHGMLYKDIIKKYNEDFAATYARCQTRALENYASIIEQNKIECDFERVFTCLYSVKEKDELKKEFEACKIAGLDARLERNTGLPFAVKGALYLDNQAQFNPLAFLDYISSQITIYPHTRATTIDGNTVITPDGAVRARYIVVATHYPFIDTPGHYYVRMHQSRSYVLALQGAKTDGAYLGIDGQQLSFRSYRDYVLLGGGGHRTGENESGKKYDLLRSYAAMYYPDACEAAHFSAQDCMTHDNLPFIGRYSKDSETVLIASGFNKWGMTNSMTAAMLITDFITGKSDFPRVFSPQREGFFPSLAKLFVDGAQLVSGVLKENLTTPQATVADLDNGRGGIVTYQGKKYGAYKDEEGKVCLVDTRCPHMGCELSFNPDEHSFECSCHGSRFDCCGRVTDGPAPVDLRSQKI